MVLDNQALINLLSPDSFHLFTTWAFVVAYTRCTCGRCGAPAVVGFAGKRQWMELLNIGRKGRDKITRLEHGVQAERPQVRVGPHLACMRMRSAASCLVRFLQHMCAFSWLATRWQEILLVGCAVLEDLI